MAKIILDIDEKNISTVLTILKNLKPDLINSIKQNEKDTPKPVSSSITMQNNKKYLSKDQYKKRVNQKILEDEFLPKKTTVKNKYLSAEEFKKRIKGE